MKNSTRFVPAASPLLLWLMPKSESVLLKRHFRRAQQSVYVYVLCIHSQTKERIKYYVVRTTVTCTQPAREYNEFSRPCQIGIKKNSIDCTIANTGDAVGTTEMIAGCRQS